MGRKGRENKGERKVDNKAKGKNVGRELLSWIEVGI